MEGFLHVPLRSPHAQVTTRADTGRLAFRGVWCSSYSSLATSASPRGHLQVSSRHRGLPSGHRKVGGGGGEGRKKVSNFLIRARKSETSFQYQKVRNLCPHRKKVYERWEIVFFLQNHKIIKLFHISLVFLPTSGNSECFSNMKYRKS